ncbi:hypothetical protein [Streptomyces niveus]|uniref:PknH-like extracellular domain-containing protein n=1 Tax=Streptomyces niveus TaxID=193462 RepID=A0ABZ2A0L1_STRNV|nr:hypothetical protein [Streptomyces niveus]
MTADGNMRNRPTRRALTAITTAALAGALALSVSGSVQAAPKATTPGFLAAKDMPPAAGNFWTAGGITAGAPETDPFCLEKVLPAKGTTWHRVFGTDLDTGGVQVSVRAASDSAAGKLAASAEASVAACAADWLRATPGGTASWDDYGRLAVEDGARVVGVATSVPDSGADVRLLGIGRDGDTVTIVVWSQLGNLGQAPVAAFKKTTTTAVNKLR